MTTVKSLKVFKYQVAQLAKQKDATLFHCYCHGDIFKIATAKKVQQFDFSNIKNDKKICKYIDDAIKILRQHLPQQKLLFSDIKFEHND